MKIKIISDLHVDINKNTNWNFDPKTFYIIAGDISGSYKTTAEFVRKNIKRGVFVAGNHLGYDGEPIEDGCDYLRKEFGTGPIRFLNNNVYKVGDVVFIGCTLYTDFDLFGDINLGMTSAWSYLNDFRYCNCRSINGHVQRLIPQKTIEWHKNSIRYLRRKLEHYKNNKIIIVTHHAPCIRSINSYYMKDPVSPAYASNLDFIMKDYTNIAYWIHGHIHSKANYKVSNTNVICNPYGYFNENDMDINDLGIEVNV